MDSSRFHHPERDPPLRAKRAFPSRESRARRPRPSAERSQAHRRIGERKQAGELRVSARSRHWRSRPLSDGMRVIGLCYDKVIGQSCTSQFITNKPSRARCLTASSRCRHFCSESRASQTTTEGFRDVRDFQSPDFYLSGTLLRFALWL